MWNGWVDNERHGTYICGHWNYEAPLRKDVYVVSTGDSVELLVNGRSVGFGERSNGFMFTFKDIEYKSGVIEAVAYNARQITSRHRLETAGAPERIRLTALSAPDGFKADGADVAVIEVEVVDKEGRRCPLDNSMIDFKLEGEGVWLGGMAKGEEGNYVGKTALPVECGVNRVLVRSTRKAGKITISAVETMHAQSLQASTPPSPQPTTATSLQPATITLQTIPFKTVNGLSTYISGDYQPSYLERGETPSGASFTVERRAIEIVATTAGANEHSARNAFDDNELSEWQNDGSLSTGWIKFELAHDAVVSQIEMKLTGWRSRSYPLQIFVDDTKVWQGATDKSLGYINIPFTPVRGRFIKIQLTGANAEQDAFGGIVEVAAASASALDLAAAAGAATATATTTTTATTVAAPASVTPPPSSHALRIVEIEVYE